MHTSLVVQVDLVDQLQDLKLGGLEVQGVLGDQVVQECHRFQVVLEALEDQEDLSWCHNWYISDFELYPKVPAHCTSHSTHF